MSDRIPLQRGHQLTLEERQAIFDVVNGLAAYEGGIVTSIRGASPIVIKAPRSSRLQELLSAAGYNVRHAGLAMHMMPHATTVVEAGLHSSSPPTRTVTHAGLIECDCLEVNV